MTLLLALSVTVKTLFGMARKILALLSLLAVVSVNAQTGSWKGELGVQGFKLPLVFNFTADGCTVDSPSQGVKGIAAEKSSSENNKIIVKIASLGAVFEGTNYGDSICGTFGQGGLSVPLTLKPGTVEVKRPQTPVPPFPYKEEDVSFTSGKFTLNGTLTLPDGYTKDTPVVLMVTGSGQQNRDEEIFEHKPFAVLADALARQGIASLRYDDRGYGDSSVNFTDFTTDDFCQDAEAGVNMLRTRFGKVGILGHSEGGTVALMLGAGHKVDFIVSLAAMAISGKETLLQQNRRALSMVGLSADMLDKTTSIINTVFSALAEGKNFDDIKIEGLGENTRPLLEKIKEPLNTPYMLHFLKMDVSKQLPLVTCPVLALNGKNDTQVDCDSNISALEKGLSNSKHTVRALDGLNHLFQHSQTGSVMEYQQIEETISPEVIDTIVTWIKAQR